MGDLAIHTLRIEARALIGWGIATVALIGSVLAFWPSIGDNSSLTESFKDLPQSVQVATGLADLGTPEGYLQGQLFSTLVPLIFLSLAIGRGARAIAGEEEAGTMDLVLTTPIRRSRVVVEKFAAIAAELVGLGIVMLVSLVVIGPLVDIDISVGKLAAATFGGVSLGVFYAGLALALSAATGRRALSLGIAAGLAGAGFLFTSIAPSVSGLDGILWISPFDHAYSYEPLVNGLDVGDTAILLGGAAVLVAAAAALFNRRDVGH